MTATPASARARPPSLVPAAEVALAAVSLATVAGLWRLFVDGSFFWPLAAHALGAHALAALCRRRGVSTLASGALTVVAAGLALTWLHLGESTWAGLPTPGTISAAGDRLDEAWTVFADVRAPAPVMPGFLLAAGAALWAGAWLSDLAAFRLWTSFEALVPTGTVFVFASIFAADRARIAATALWLAAALAFVLVHRTARERTSPSWLGSDPRLGTTALLRVGAGLVAIAVVAGWAIGPRLPGASADAIVDFRELDEGGGSRSTVSPLVEIQGRMLEQSEIELFTVRSTQRAYWRLTSLDEFDGDVWETRGSFGEADGSLDRAGDGPPGTVEVVQQVAVSGLSAIWLPAAFEPRSIDPGDAEVRWEAESSTLIVSTDTPTSDGLVYEVTSAVPVGLSADALGGVGPVPDEVATVGTALPPGFPASVVAEAQRIVAGATTPYEQALALQSSFRDGTFTYTLDVPPGHSDSAIEEFLFVRRSGYCEQFAGTYAAMARAVGLPARVAVGFTPGIADASDPSLYHVRGEHAHAWPEVWIPGAGWTAFEPTPGRGAPNAPYTGVEESQDTAGPSTEPTTVPTTAVPAPDPTGPGGPGPQSTAEPGPGITEPDAAGDPVPGPPKASDSVETWAKRTALGLGAMTAVLVVGAVCLAAWRLARRWYRWRRAKTADEVAQSAWTDVLETIAMAGFEPRPYETPVEFAHRMTLMLGDDRLIALAWTIEQGWYGPPGLATDTSEELTALAAAIREQLRARMTRWQRVLGLIDPRPARRRRRTQLSGAGPRIQIRHAD